MSAAQAQPSYFAARTRRDITPACHGGGAPQRAPRRVAANPPGRQRAPLGTAGRYPRAGPVSGRRSARTRCGAASSSARPGVRPLRDSPCTARRSRGSEPQKPRAPTACGGGAGVLPATATRRAHRLDGTEPRRVFRRAAARQNPARAVRDGLLRLHMRALPPAEPGGDADMRATAPATD